MPTDDSKRRRKLVAAILSLQPRRPNVAALRTVFEKLAKVQNQSQLADAFDVSTQSVRNNWRRDGMPGAAGNYSVAEVLAWYLERDQRSKRTVGKPLSQRNGNGNGEDLSGVKAADFRIKQAKAEREELETLRVRHGWVPRDAVQEEFRSILSIFREQALQIPRQLRPMLPDDLADDVCGEVDRLIRHALTALAEMPVEKYLDQVDKAKKGKGKQG